jgi:parallel beta-helix repeat protein
MFLMEDCVIEGGAPTVALRGKDTALKRCLITGGKTGLHIGTGVGIEIEDCSIVGNDGPGVVLEENHVVLKDCRIYENEGPGVQFSYSMSVIKGCEIHHNKAAGIYVTNMSQPRIQKCHIHDNDARSAAISLSSGTYSAGSSLPHHYRSCPWLRNPSPPPGRLLRFARVISTLTAQLLLIGNLSTSL